MLGSVLNPLVLTLCTMIPTKMENICDPCDIQIDQVTRNTRFAEVKAWIFRLSAYLCSLSSLGFGIMLAGSRYWHLWEFDSDIVRLVYIGLWEVYYHQEFNISNSVTKILLHRPINSDWTIVPEIKYGQNLILFSILVKPVVLIFTSVAIRVSYIKARLPEIQMFCYKSSAVILILSSLCTAVAVSWNHVVDFDGHSTLDFPSDFPVSKDVLIRKHHTHVFPVGVLTAALSFLGVVMFACEMRSLQQQDQVKLQLTSQLGHQNT